MSKLKSLSSILLAIVIAVIVIMQVLVEYKEHPRMVIAVEKINKFINDKRMFVTIGGRKDEEPVVIDDILTDINVTTINDGNRLGFHNLGPLFILNVAAGNKSVDAKWDIFKVYGVIDMKRYPNYEQNLKCCFLFNSDGDQEIVEMRPISKELFWKLAILRTFHVTCPNPRIGVVPDGVSVAMLHIPCQSGTNSYIAPFYPKRQPGTTLALGTKIAYGNISPELIIEWMETYKFLGVDKVVTYYVQNLNPSALQVLQYYAVEGSLDLYLFEPAASDLYPRTYHPPNPQRWNDNNVAAKDQFERMSGYTYFGILDHDEFLIPSGNRSLKQMMDDLFRRSNGTVANFEFGEIQFSLSWEATGVVRDLYLDRYIRRTDFPLDFLIQKNIYRPSMINAGSMNTHFILPRNLTSELSALEHRKLWCLLTLCWLSDERSLLIGLLLFGKGRQKKKATFDIFAPANLRLFFSVVNTLDELQTQKWRTGQTISETMCTMYENRCLAMKKYSSFNVILLSLNPLDELQTLKWRTGQTIKETMCTMQKNGCLMMKKYSSFDPYPAKLEYFRRQITDTEMAYWANNISDNVHHVRKKVFGDEKVFVV